METVISTLIVAALIILAVVGLSQTSLSAQSTIAQSTGQMQERAGDRARTSLTAVSAQTTPLGDAVQITLKNTGSTKLATFNEWDVILQYSDGTSNHAQWYSFGSGVNQWSEQLYQVVPTPEAIDPGIFDPGEEMVVTVNVSPAVGIGTTNVAVVSAPNGITASAIFQH